MNKKRNLDSDFCGNLPLNQVNLIQPYGYLLVLERSSLHIVQVSENVDKLFGKTAKELAGTPLEEVLSASEMDAVRKKINSGLERAIPFSFSSAPAVENAQPHLALIHVKENYILMEIETPHEQPQRSFAEVYQDIKFVMERIDTGTSVTEVCNYAAAELKRLSGFDKVMVYSFDEDWNGSVLAEEMEEGMESYLGLKFPASDIPRQARALYLKNPYRLIPSRTYSPVRLYPVLNPITRGFVDMSDCNLRSVAPVHLEYLANMNVTASMSTRIIVANKLWGLISCHHRTENRLSYEMCAVFELLSNYIASKISSVIHEENVARISKLQALRTELIKEVLSGSSLEDSLFHQQVSVLQLLNAGGAALSLNKKISVSGNVPEPGDLEDLFFWLQTKNIDQVYTENSLSAVFEEAERYTDVASGMLAIPIVADNGDYLVLFRPETIKTVTWGGNPDNAITFENNGERYHPRNSFDVWKERVKKTSEPWEAEELEIASDISGIMYKMSTRHTY